jgi:hypothetical protein
LDDGDEVNLYGTDPADADTDGDNFDDGFEIAQGSDPTDPSSTPPLLLFGATQQSGGPSDLHLIDSVTGAASLIGPIGFNRVSGMEADDIGRLYATAVHPSTGVHMWISIDPFTGAGTAIGPSGVDTLGFDSVAGLAYRGATGTFYAYFEADDVLGTIDQMTGAASAIGDTFSTGCCGNGISFSTVDVLYQATEGPLATLDLLTGASTDIVGLTFSPPADDFPRINGMDFLPGTDILYAALNDGSGGMPENHLALVDIVTGIVTIIGPTADGLDGLAWVLFLDTDNDGLTDAEEVGTYGTDPANPDTDGGGRSDGDEVLVDGTDPLNPADDI